MARTPSRSKRQWMFAIKGDPESESFAGRCSSDGVAALIAERLGFSESYVYRKMKDGSKLGGQIKAAIDFERDIFLAKRQARTEIIVDKSMDNVELFIEAGDIKVSLWALEKFGKYGSRVEMTGKDGSDLFSETDIDLLARLGMSPGQAVDAIMQAYKEAAEDNGDD
ncbi:hypothetical protein KAR91_43200 [Candidatus Pacearchaeota archaeon]|nr:hypothetical protein [Candidatus Pacearchaeota archaeon]